MIMMINLVALKAATKMELLSNKLEASLFDKRSCLAPVLCVTKLTNARAMILITNHGYDD
jgi:hypothetical protein